MADWRAGYVICAVCGQRVQAYVKKLGIAPPTLRAIRHGEPGPVKPYCLGSYRLGKIMGKTAGS